MKQDRALVLFSGGQDSSIALAWALEQFHAVETIAFDYGQRHAVAEIIALLKNLDGHLGKRLAVLISLSGDGGVERMVLNLCAEFAKHVKVDLPRH